MNKTISITNARKDIYNIAQEVSDGSTYYTLTEKGRGKVVIMSVDEFEAWKETIDILEDNPNIQEDIKKAEKELKLGKTVSLEELE